jgi:hypothetical protein
MAQTRPDLSDSDGGGESDGSELAAGRDPNDRADDVVGTPNLVPEPGNARVLLHTGIGALDGATLEIHAAATRAGPFALEHSSGDQPSAVMLPASNGVERCYTGRLVKPSAVSGWSSVVCATPAADPVPPRVLSLGLDPEAPCARTRAARLRIEAVDPTFDASIAGEHRRGGDLGVETSGVAEMRVSTSRSPQIGAWEPFSSTFDVDLGDATTLTAMVRLRDHAGNETADQMVTVRRCDGSGLERAVVLEERALDRMDANDWSGSRKLIRGSLPEIDASVEVVKKRLKNCAPNQKAADLKLLAGLQVVRVKKLLAIQFAQAYSGHVARHQLEKALELEGELDVYALAHGKTL